MHGMYGTQDAELEVQRTIKRAELTAFLCFLREASGPTVVHVDKSRLASVCAPRVASWCLREFLLSRLRAYRGTHARKFRVCVEKGWGSPHHSPLRSPTLRTGNRALNSQTPCPRTPRTYPGAGGWEN